jgi:hypothetical protein
MDRPSLNQESGTLLLDEYGLQINSYRRIVEDEAITDDELVEQTQRAISPITWYAIPGSQGGVASCSCSTTRPQSTALPLGPFL